MKNNSLKRINGVSYLSHWNMRFIIIHFVLYILDFVSNESVPPPIGAPKWPNMVLHYILYRMFRIFNRTTSFVNLTELNCAISRRLKLVFRPISNLIMLRDLMKWAGETPPSGSRNRITKTEKYAFSVTPFSIDDQEEQTAQRNPDNLSCELQLTRYIYISLLFLRNV